MRIVRCYLLPNGEQYVDWPMPDGMVTANLLQAVTLNQVFLTDDAVVPWRTIHHLRVLEAQVDARGKVVPLTPVNGGKPAA